MLIIQNTREVDVNKNPQLTLQRLTLVISISLDKCKLLAGFPVLFVFVLFWSHDLRSSECSVRTENV